MPPSLDAVDDTMFAVVNCSHALRVTEGMAVCSSG